MCAVYSISLVMLIPMSNSCIHTANAYLLFMFFQVIELKVSIIISSVHELILCVGVISTFESDTSNL